LEKTTERIETVAKDEILKYENWAVGIARRVAKEKGIEGLDREGLENTARFTCWLAVKKYDPKKCRSFYRFARKRVTWACRDEVELLSDNRLELRRERKRPKREDQQRPSPRDYIPRTKVRRLNRHAWRAAYLDKGLNRLDSEEYIEFLLDMVRDPCDRKLCELHFVSGHLRHECARRVGISPGRAGQRIKRAIEDIRDRLGEEP
jgi:RNA polymerase sigma factor (sigma-70 family)